MRADELFVFAGAGVSLGAPSELPTFNAIRDDLLHQLTLDEYIPNDQPEQSGKQQIVRGLAPEPFLLALQHAGTRIDKWMVETLDAGAPNAVHCALADLLAAGSAVWTVNFDGLIEAAASASLKVSAWPNRPKGKGLLKPHGTIPGPLIFTAQDVLRPLDVAWKDRLARDISRCSTAVFIGYSGRDLDFQPLWDQLTKGKDLLWFDFPNPAEQARKRALLPTAVASGRLTFPALSPRGSRRLNPSADFVEWCHQEGLSEPSAPLFQALLLDPKTRPFPSLEGDLEAGRAAVLSILGGHRAAASIYRHRVVRGPERHAAAAELVSLRLNHGGRGTVPMLSLAKMLPHTGRLGVTRATLLRKRASLLFVAGRHEELLRATQDTSDLQSTIQILRSGSLRVTGSLTQAAVEAAAALQAARTEQHPVRIANAALQSCYALMWAGRLDESRRVLDEALRPYGGLASARWVAWADIIEGCLSIHAGDPRTALHLFDRAQACFAAEGLSDGTVSTLIVKLTAHRQGGDVQAFEDGLNAASALLDGQTEGTYYAPGHIFTREALQFERGEYLYHLRGDTEAAHDALQTVAKSIYPVHSALGLLALAHHSREPIERQRFAEAGLATAIDIGAEKAALAAREILASTGDRHELYFP